MYHLLRREASALSHVRNAIQCAMCNWNASKLYHITPEHNHPIRQMQRYDDVQFKCAIQNRLKVSNKPTWEWRRLCAIYLLWSFWVGEPEVNHHRAMIVNWNSLFLHLTPSRNLCPPFVYILNPFGHEIISRYDFMHADEYAAQRLASYSNWFTR